MILAWLIAVPVIGALLAGLMPARSRNGCRCLAIVILGVQLGLSVHLLSLANGTSKGNRWLVEIDIPWIHQLGIQFHLGIDELSLWMTVLTGFIGIIAIISSWNEVKTRVGLYHCQLLLAIAGITGVFLALDLFLFYVFWELMLVPTCFLISIWGDRNRTPAAIRFFIFTQTGGLLMLVSILALYFIHGRSTGNYTFNYSDLLNTTMSPAVALWLASGFAIAFLVKMPILPFHTWLPQAYASAPTGCSILLAALLSKTGAYGLIRFVKPLFPQATAQMAPLIMGLGAAGILYGAIMAFGQRDLKRLIGYSSISHVNFIVLGVFAGTMVSMQGAVIQMIAHAASVAGIFLVVGAIQDRTGSRNMDETGGFWHAAPRMGSAGMLFALASLGLPGLGNFVGEFLVLAGSFQTNAVLAGTATIGFVFSVSYALWMVQAVFQGRVRPTSGIADFTGREAVTAAVLAIVLLWLGCYPTPIFKTVDGALSSIQGASSTLTAGQYILGNTTSTRSP